MPFFEHPPPNVNEDSAEEEDDAYDHSPQASYLGGVVPVELLVARSEVGAVAIRGLVAYPDGFEFTVVAYMRALRGRRPRRFLGTPLLIDHFGIERGDDLPEGFLRLGIEFPDGARVTNLDSASWELGPDATEPEHGMESHSGGGSDTVYEQEFWAWPLPGKGPLSFVCEWPAYEIPESQVEIDGGLVAAAAGRAQQIWPQDIGPSHMTRIGMMRHLEARAGDHEGEDRP